MKKQILAAITAALILTSITACKESDPENRPGDQGFSEADNSTLTSAEIPSSAENESSSNDSSSDNSSADSEPVKEVKVVFDKTKIPDIQGPLSESSLQPLESMVFEIYKYGDYTVSLIGEDVRTNKELFPERIMTSALRIEVEKNGVILGEGAGYLNQFACGEQFPTLTLFEDKLGSYISLYDMEVPVIAMKYYFHESDPTDVEKALMFVTIQNEEVGYGFVGATYDPIGVEITGKISESAAMNGEKHRYPVFIFGSEEFEVVDGQTLVDKEAGIKYTFDFSDPTLFERYTAEKVN